MTPVRRKSSAPRPAPSWSRLHPALAPWALCSVGEVGDGHGLDLQLGRGGVLDRREADDDAQRDRALSYLVLLSTRALFEGGCSVSYMRTMTTMPESAVRAATAQMAASMETASAMRPARRAPMAKPLSRQSR